MSDSVNLVPGLDALGASYNVIEKRYADPEAIGFPMVNFQPAGTQACTIGGVQYQCWKQLNLPSVGGSSHREFVGSTEYDYQNDISVKAGVKGGYDNFSGELNTSYSEEVDKTQDTYYWMISDNQQVWAARFQQSQVDLSSSTPQSGYAYGVTDTLLEAFKSWNKQGSKQDWDNWFHDNGTHIVTGIVIGGRAKFSCYATRDSYSDQTEFEVDAKAKYTDLSGSATFKSDYDNKTSTYQQTAKTFADLEVWGGDPTKAAQVDGEPANFTAWQNSVPARPLFIDFFENGGLTPIWQFCADSDTKSSIQDAFNTLYSRLQTDHRSDWIKATAGSITYSAADHPLSWEAEDSYEVVVGFGGHINDDKHLDFMTVRVFNLQTGETYDKDVDAGGKKNYEPETVPKLPNRGIVTGLCVSRDSTHMGPMRIAYQYLEPAGSGYLSATVNSDTDWGNYGSQDEYQREYVPGEKGIAKGSVLVALRMYSSSEQHGFIQLDVKTATLVPATT